jgi:hypothetical protein
MFFKIKSTCSNIFLALASLLQISFIISSEYVLQVNSATALQEIEENPEYPEKCYLESSKTSHALGSTWQVPEMVCAEATCYRSGSPNKFLIAYQTCGLVGAGPDCELIEDLTLPYPACCPTIRCSKTSGESEDTKPNELHISSRPNDIQPSSEFQSFGADRSSLNSKNTDKKEDPRVNQPSIRLFDILRGPLQHHEKFDFEFDDTNEISNPFLIRVP